MADINNLLQNKVVSPNVETIGYIKSYGVVIRSFEKDNVCDIKYLDAKNRIINKDRVFVKVTNNDDWFPDPGDVVEIELNEQFVWIIGRVTYNYSKQIKPDNVAKTDIYADGADSSVGCYIF